MNRYDTDRPDHPARAACRYAGYIVGADPVVVACRCVVCVRCGQHTGNATQGHYWRWCKATGGFREFHLCCPDDCELET